MNCRRCGEILNANANFCWSCGAPQHDATSAETIAMPVVTAVETPISNAARGPVGEHVDELVIITGNAAGTRFEVTKEVTTAGRDEHSDLLLDDVS
ncbi:MAG TPA: hypothetical protein VII84_04700, partial [Acidimicrobiales bacterium]